MKVLDCNGKKLRVGDRVRRSFQVGVPGDLLPSGIVVDIDRRSVLVEFAPGHPRPFNAPRDLLRRRCSDLAKLTPTQGAE